MVAHSPYGPPGEHGTAVDNAIALRTPAISDFRNRLGTSGRFERSVRTPQCASSSLSRDKLDDQLR